jgi:hypothetical protein
MDPIAGRGCQDRHVLKVGIRRPCLSRAELVTIWSAFLSRADFPYPTVATASRCLAHKMPANGSVGSICLARPKRFELPTVGFVDDRFRAIVSPNRAWRIYEHSLAKKRVDFWMLVCGRFVVGLLRAASCARER